MLDGRLGQMYETVIFFTDKILGRESPEVKGVPTDTT